MTVLLLGWVESRIAQKSVGDKKSVIDLKVEQSKVEQLKVQSAQVSPQNSGSPIVLDSKPLMSLLPSNALIRAEAESDPHQTPASLLRFGADLGVRMARARTSESVAADLLTQLGQCAGDSPLQVQALCLVSAHELGGLWPALHPKAQQIIRSADPKTLQLASRLGSLN